jgi:hypothetical protein
VTPLFTVALLFWAMLGFGIIAVALDIPSCRLIRSSWKMVCLVVLATVIWRVPWDGVFFHGLEYEDSYVYTVAGRQLAEHVRSSLGSAGLPFSFTVCAMGSIQDCAVWVPFPEHLIGYPYVISLAIHLFGYTPEVGSILNIVASSISAVLVFMLALAIAEDSLVALLAGLLFAIVPAFAVYGLETSAEPFSGCCILLALWFCFSMWRTEAVNAATRMFRWCAYTCSLLFAQTVKREDALLALLLPITMLLIVSSGDRKVAGRLTRMGLMIVSSVLATSQNEQELLQQFPFTSARFFGIVENYLASFGVLRWYGASSLVVFAGIVFAFRKRNFALVPAVLLVTFIAVYASHIRGYYEMESGRVSPESALRFSMNLMGLWAITGGLGLGWLVRWLMRHREVRSREKYLDYCLHATGAILLLASFVTTVYLRRDAVEDETNSRIIPARVAIKVASLEIVHRSFILTMDPLVVQMFADTNMRVVDLESLDMPMVNELLASKAQLLLLKKNDRFMEADLKRYGGPVLWVLSLHARILDSGDGFTVSLIDGSRDPQ